MLFSDVPFHGATTQQFTTKWAFRSYIMDSFFMRLQSTYINSLPTYITLALKSLGVVLVFMKN